MAGITTERSAAQRGATGRELSNERGRRLRSWPRPWLAVVLVLTLLGMYNGFIYHPHLDQPHRFAILALVFYIGLAGTVVWCGLLFGLRGLRALRLSDGNALFSAGERVALATGLGLGGLSLLTLGLGAVHLFYGATFAVLLAGLPLLLRREAVEAVGLLRALTAPVRAWHLRRRAEITHEALLCAPPILLCLGVAAFMLAADMIPPGYLGYDTYQYHWAVPLLLLRAHGWLAFPGWAHANLPFGTEMLNLIALSVGAPQAATIIQDTFLLLSVLVIFALARRCFGPTAAWLTVLAVITIPVLLAYSTFSYVEAALIFYGLAGMAVLYHWLERVLVRDNLSAHTRLLVLAGLYLGLSLGVKYTALEYLPAAALTVIGGLGVSMWRARRTRSPGLTVARAIGALAAFASAMAGPFIPWLLKDWVLLGDPFYPALPQIFATPLWNAARTETLRDTFANFGTHSGALAQLRLYIVDMFVNPAPYGEGRAFPIGSLIASSLLVMPYFAYKLVGRGYRKRWSSGPAPLLVAVLTLWAVSALCVWTFSSALVERYALPGIVLATLVGAVLLGWIVASIPDRLRLVRWPFVLMISVLCFTYTAAFLFPTVYFRSPVAVISGSVSEQSYFRANAGQGLEPAFFEAVDYVNGTLPHDGRLLMLGRGSGYFFIQRDYVADSGEDWVPYIVSEGKTPDGMLGLLHQQGFSYVIYDADVIRFVIHDYGNKEISSVLPAYLAFQREKLIPVAQWDDILLFRVP